MDDMSVAFHQAGIGTVAVYLIQYLKDKKWAPFINHNSATINRWTGALVAIVTAVGVNYAAQGSWATGWHIAIDIPSAKVLLETAVHAAAQFSGQQVLYHTAVAADK